MFFELNMEGLQGKLRQTNYEPEIAKEKQVFPFAILSFFRNFAARNHTSLLSHEEKSNLALHSVSSHCPVRFGSNRRILSADPILQPVGDITSIHRQ